MSAPEEIVVRLQDEERARTFALILDTIVLPGAEGDDAILVESVISQLRERTRPIGQPDADGRLHCANCGSSDLWVWYQSWDRQTIEARLDEHGAVQYDYTGNTRGGDADEDVEYTCGDCGAVTETIEELVGRPRPPFLGRKLSEHDALELLFPADEPTADDDFPSGADFIEAVCQHFAFERETFEAFCKQKRWQARGPGPGSDLPPEAQEGGE